MSKPQMRFTRESHTLELFVLVPLNKPVIIALFARPGHCWVVMVWPGDRSQATTTSGGLAMDELEANDPPWGCGRRGSDAAPITIDSLYEGLKYVGPYDPRPVTFETHGHLLLDEGQGAHVPEVMTIHLFIIANTSRHAARLRAPGVGVRRLAEGRPARKDMDTRSTPNAA